VYTPTLRALEKEQKNMSWKAYLISLSLSGMAAITPLKGDIIWNISPSTFPVTSGAIVNADIILNGKIPGSAPSIGSFDFAVAFDPLLLTPLNVSFGNFLGDPGLGESITTFTFATPGLVDFGAVSLLPPEELNALQPSSFTLATMTFQAKGDGTASLSFTSEIVDDAFGIKLPEPGTFWLGGLALAGLVRRATSRGQQEHRQHRSRGSAVESRPQVAA